MLHQFASLGREFLFCKTRVGLNHRSQNVWTHVGVGLGPSLLSFIQSHFYADAFYFGGFPDSSAVKNLPAMQQEMQET